VKAKQEMGTPSKRDMPKQGETPSGTAKRPRPKSNTPTERIRLPEGHRGPGILNEALKTIFKEK
jgi:hypothetical protein